MDHVGVTKEVRILNDSRASVQRSFPSHTTWEKQVTFCKEALWVKYFSTKMLHFSEHNIFERICHSYRRDLSLSLLKKLSWGQLAFSRQLFSCTVITVCVLEVKFEKLAHNLLSWKQPYNLHRYCGRVGCGIRLWSIWGPMHRTRQCMVWDTHVIWGLSFKKKLCSVRDKSKEKVSSSIQV